MNGSGDFMDVTPIQDEKWPENIGIVAMELYFPKMFVSQKKLEEFDGVSQGKYRIGLGQEKMGFCSDREDVHSVCLTVTKNLLENYQIDLSRVGRLEVGTETIIDKSKSVKSVLMQLFEDSGNFSLEGADTTNACFGGTQALFNAVNWIESSSWDGRYALVVMGDIAVYAKGPARCTGGAGAMAILVGPDAPIVVERGLRAVHVRHAYDFYKPNLNSEYPVVDGQLSVQSYLSALDACYTEYCSKASKRSAGKEVSLQDYDAVLFHSPYCKLVQKSLARLAFLDFRRNKYAQNGYSALEEFRNLKLDKTYLDKALEKICMTFSADLFEQKTVPSLLFARNIGNMYTPSLYGCLSAFLLSMDVDLLHGKRAMLFSYGSGLAAAMFSVKIRSSGRQELSRIWENLENAKIRLSHRREVSPQDFTAALNLREDLLGKAPFVPKGEVAGNFFLNTFYLVSIDEKYRRTYQRYQIEQNGLSNVDCEKD